MVRRIRVCSSCGHRFISRTSQIEQCKGCGPTQEKMQTLAGDDRDNKQSAKRFKTSAEIVVETFPLEKAINGSASNSAGIEKKNISNPETSETKTLPEMWESSSSDGGSEANDDFHCSQIVEENCLDTEDNEDSSITNLNGNLVRSEEKNEINVDKEEKEDNIITNLNDLANDNREDKNDGVSVDPQVSTNDICFICGKSLAGIKSGLKGRLNHIKRCSKKHGVTPQDVRINDDHEIFTESSYGQSANITTNPATESTNWHGDASECLPLPDTFSKAESTNINSANCDEATETSNNIGSINKESMKRSVDTSRQTTMSTFFKAPVRSLNSVLLAGSKNMSKVSKLKAADNPRKRGNGGFFGRRRNVDYSKLNCPLYKRISGTDFICDGFMYARSSLSKSYFLTHFHSDHYGGITRSWNAGVIYCSLITANLVHQQLGVDKKYLHPLSMQIPTIIESNGRPVRVTLLDANHCPGAVMFLFEIGKRRILHVGDFRWNQEVMLLQAPLRQLASALDELFLDTTYCDPKYCLPTQEQAINATIETATTEIENSRSDGRRLLMLFGAYTIGKERIYLSVAEKLKLKVYVDSRRYKILSTLEWSKQRLALLTKNKEETPLWVVPLGHINMKKMAPYLTGNSNKKGASKKYDKVVGFRPTGWSLSSPSSSSSNIGKKQSIISSRSSGCLTVHGVPYSEHSSFPELLDCLDYLKPKKIVPTVSASKSQEQIALLISELQRRRKTNELHIPRN